MFYSIFIDLHQLIYLLRNKIVIYIATNMTKGTDEMPSVPSL